MNKHRFSCSSLFLGLITAITLCSTSLFAQDLKLDGTYRLVKREIPGGPTLTPPAVMGLVNYAKGHRSVNVFWHTPDGSPASLSINATYKLTSSEFTQTIMFFSFNDPSSGKPVAYTLDETGSVPVHREGGRIRFTPPEGGPELVFDANGHVATLNGVFVDYWEKVK
jgi:hypothetical protein